MTNYTKDEEESVIRLVREKKHKIKSHSIARKQSERTKKITCKADMQKIFAGIQILDKPQEFLPINVDFEQDVEYLKKIIAEKIEFDVNNLELVFHGRVLINDQKLKDIENIKPNGIVHCFKKTKQYEPYKPKTWNDEDIERLTDLFLIVEHIQISVTSRVTILQKILNEYPEFRRNLGAQAIIRDSVLFNTLNQKETMKKLAENYPIICEASPFIVDTIKKELTRPAAARVIEINESPNSSEEESSLGAGSSNDSGTPATQSEDSRIRAITRQQLQDALAGVANTTNNSVNSLSNIAQRNVDSNNTAPLTSSASGERITAEMLRRAMLGSTGLISSTSPTTSADNTVNDVQPMDTSDTNAALDENNDTIPATYRNHEYAEQLRTMSQMGFLNHEENLTFLTLTNGNIGNAVNLLMGAPNE